MTNQYSSIIDNTLGLEDAEDIQNNLTIENAHSISQARSVKVGHQKPPLSMAQSIMAVRRNKRQVKNEFVTSINMILKSLKEVGTLPRYSENLLKPTKSGL